MDLEAELVRLGKEVAQLRARVRTLEARSGDQAITVGSKTGRTGTVRLSNDGQSLEVEASQ